MAAPKFSRNGYWWRLAPGIFIALAAAPVWAGTAGVTQRAGNGVTAGINAVAPTPTTGRDPVAGTATAAPLVRVLAVLQTRGVLYTLNRKPYQRALGGQIGLKVILRVFDRRIPYPEAFTHLSVVTGFCNDGSILQLARPRFTAWHPVAGALWTHMRQAGELGFPVTLHFLSLPPKARVIRQLAGSFEVIGQGQRQQVTVSDLAAHLGRRLRTGHLAAWGLRVRLSRCGKIGDQLYLPLRIQGPKHALTALAVRRDGKLINHGYIATGGGTQGAAKSAIVLAPLTRLVDQKTTLVLTFAVRRPRQKVAFHFYNIPIP